MFIQQWEKEEARRKAARDAIAKLVQDTLLERTVKIPPLPLPPGVYEDEIHPLGEHWYKILMPNGKVGTVRVPDELWDESLLLNLVRRFEAKTKRRLKVI